MEQENKTTIAEEVIKKLDQEKIEPIARWHFVLRNNSFWTLWGISVLIGSCATAASIFVFINAGWQYRGLTHDSFLKFILDVMPLFWFLSFICMMIFGYYNIRHTSRGYRFSFYLVALASILASFIGGTLLYAVGVGKDIDDFRKPLPFATPITSLEEQRWNDVNRGLVSGIVKSFDNDTQELTLTLFSGAERVISTTELSVGDTSHFVVGTRIRIIGGFDTDDIEKFVACAVVPWNIEGRSKNTSDVYIPPQAHFERKEINERISICKDVRPYQDFKQVLIRH